jgi:hypothetical protein
MKNLIFSGEWYRNFIGAKKKKKIKRATFKAYNF